MNPFNWMLIGESHCSCRAHTTFSTATTRRKWIKGKLDFLLVLFLHFVRASEIFVLSTHDTHDDDVANREYIDAGTRARNLRFSDNVFQCQHQTTSHRSLIMFLLLFSSFVVLLLLLSWVKVIVVSGPHTPPQLIYYTPPCAAAAVYCVSQVKSCEINFPCHPPPATAREDFNMLESNKMSKKLFLNIGMSDFLFSMWMNSQRKSRWTRRCRMRLSGAQHSSTGRNLMWSKRGKFSSLQWRERKFEFFLLLTEIAHVQGLSSERHQDSSEKCSYLGKTHKII